MAQGAQRLQHEPEGEGNTNPFGITAEAWNAAAERRNFRVHNGDVIIGKDGALAPSPPPTSIDEVFHAVQEYRRNRIAGSLNGVSLVDALAKAANGEGLPSPKSNDAFDAVYADRIAELLDASKGWDVENMSKEEKAERSKLIDSYGFTGKAAATNRTKHYDAAVNAALEAGKIAGVKRVSQRKAASQKESGEL